MSQLLDFAKPHVLRNAVEYDAAVEEIDRLLDADPPPDSEDYERLEFLPVLVQAYEDARLPMDRLTTPQDVVEFMAERQAVEPTTPGGALGDPGVRTPVFGDLG